MAREAKTKAVRVDPPEHLEGDALLAFCRARDTLAAEGRLTAGDVDVLTLYAETWAGYQHARRAVHADPLTKGANGVIGKHPLYPMMKDLAGQLAALLRELKFTPASRKSDGPGAGDEDLEF